MASTKRNWPLGKGFERYYGFLGGESDQYYPDLIHDNHPVDPPRTPGEGYHLSEDLADKAISFIKDLKGLAPEKPFFMYFCPGANHAPHQAKPTVESRSPRAGASLLSGMHASSEGLRLLVGGAPRRPARGAAGLAVRSTGKTRAGARHS
jgi:arylsulfatase